MNLDLYKYIYLIGAGGIGMSALARYFNMNGKIVYGYDRVRSNLCLELEKEGVILQYQDQNSVIPKDIKRAKYNDVLVIYTPAISAKNRIFSFFVNSSFTILKRAEVLGIISREFFTIAIAGTHGKTTTSTMLAHILKNSEPRRDVTAFLGGISRNYNTNLLLSEDRDVLIVEADEYDKSFLELDVDLAIVTSVSPDHLDFYEDFNDLHKAFQEFVALIKPQGILLLEKSIDIDLPVIDSVQKFTYSATEIYSADSFVENIRLANGNMFFDMKIDSTMFDSDYYIDTDVELQMPGTHNISNAVAASAAAVCLGATKIKEALQTFIGINRRFDKHIDTDDIVYIDDYAHHPEEVSATIETAKYLYPLRHISVVFQPHLFSRTQAFASDFAVSLKKADELVLLDIFPARENPIEGVSSHMILELCQNPNKEICSKDKLLSVLQDKDLDVLLTLGAGDIGNLVQPIKQMLN